MTLDAAQSEIKFGHDQQRDRPCARDAELLHHQILSARRDNLRERAFQHA